MDEKKEKSKSIKIKNKKEAEKILSKKANTSKVKKSSNKNKSSSKSVAKKNLPNIKSNQLENEKKVSDIKKKSNNSSSDKKIKTKKVEKKSKKNTEIKTKLEIPKEWKSIAPKTKTKTKEVTSNTTKLSGKIKESIFEEIDEYEFQVERKKQKEKIKKISLVLLIVAVTVVLVLYLLFKYNGFVKKQFKTYPSYSIGDKIVLKDSSIWYVVKDSSSSEENIKLVKENVLDISGDSKIDNNDKLKYNSNNNAVLDDNNENSVAFYLKNTYKKELQDKVGEVINIGLLTTKEYIKIRDKMGFGYEWSDGNWLANQSLDNWWIDSEQNGKVYAVNPNGSFKLYNAVSSNLVRPVIEIKKELVSKYQEKENLEEKQDNGESNNQ